LATRDDRGRKPVHVDQEVVDFAEVCVGGHSACRREL
jgi:hypothetical protein